VYKEPKGEATVQSGVKERELAQKSGCFTCHSMEKKLVGPAWNDVSAKYRGQKDAETMLIAKVTKGGSGIWGSVPMPPNAPKVAEADIKTLVSFILSRK
jgi:cytochrome c